jgi:hypothetical protein
VTAATPVISSPGGGSDAPDAPRAKAVCKPLRFSAAFAAANRAATAFSCFLDAIVDGKKKDYKNASHPATKA